MARVSWDDRLRDRWAGNQEKQPNGLGLDDLQAVVGDVGARVI